MKQAFRTFFVSIVFVFLSIYPLIGQDVQIEGFTPKPYFVQGLDFV